MANAKSTNRALSNMIAKRGPVWTFYVFAVLALLVVAATIIGLTHAGSARWF